MKVWTIQPKEVLDEINNKGVYVCDPDKSEISDGMVLDYFKFGYDWIVSEMDKRIGGRPSYVKYPVWAWYIRNWEHKKPDFRNTDYGPHGAIVYCIECDIPVERLVFTDFDEFHCVLNNFPLIDAYSEKEYDEMYEEYKKLSLAEKEVFNRNSWNKIFDITPFKNDFVSRGKWVQATFWELRKSDIRKVTGFKIR